jgi:hypothetical protein
LIGGERSWNSQGLDLRGWSMPSVQTVTPGTLGVCCACLGLSEQGASQKLRSVQLTLRSSKPAIEPPVPFSLGICVGGEEAGEGERPILSQVVVSVLQCPKDLPVTSALYTDR